MHRGATSVQGVDVDTHTVEAARERLVDLRRDELQQLGVGAGAILASLGLTVAYQPLVAPLFVGGIAVWLLAIRSLWRHWDLVDRLADDPDATVIPEVAAYAERHGRAIHPADRDPGQD